MNIGPEPVDLSGVAFNEGIDFSFDNSNVREIGSGQRILAVRDRAAFEFRYGPGLPVDQREAALERGARMDETTPGSGLGLSIVVELTRAYGGRITLADSDLGGLKVLLELPAAEA